MRKQRAPSGFVLPQGIWQLLLIACLSCLDTCSGLNAATMFVRYDTVVLNTTSLWYNGAFNRSSVSDLDDVPFENMNFTMRFFNFPSVSVFLSPNGFLSISGVPPCTSFCTLTDSVGNLLTGDYPVIGAYVTDLGPLQVTNSAAVRTAHVDADRLVIQFVNVSLYNGPITPSTVLNMQIHLYSNGTVMFLYRTVIQLIPTTGLPYIGLRLSGTQQVSVPVTSVRNNSTVWFEPSEHQCNQNAACTSCLTSSAVECVWCDDYSRCIPAEHAAEMCSSFGAFTGDAPERCTGNHTSVSQSRFYYSQKITNPTHDALPDYNSPPPTWVKPTSGSTTNIALDVCCSTVDYLLDIRNNMTARFPQFYNPQPKNGSTSTARNLIGVFLVSRFGYITTAVDDQRPDPTTCPAVPASLSPVGPCTYNMVVSAYMANISRSFSSPPRISHQFMNVAGSKSVVIQWEDASPGVPSWQCDFATSAAACATRTYSPQRTFAVQLQLWESGRIAVRFRTMPNSAATDQGSLLPPFFRNRMFRTTLLPKDLNPSVTPLIGIADGTASSAKRGSSVHWSLVLPGSEVVLTPLPGCTSDCTDDAHGSCSNFPTPSTQPQCICTQDSFVGAGCAACAVGTYGSMCLPCPTCFNGGTCRDGVTGDGKCSCPFGFGGTDCSMRCNISATTFADGTPFVCAFSAATSGTVPAGRCTATAGQCTCGACSCQAYRWGEFCEYGPANATNVTVAAAPNGWQEDGSALLTSTYTTTVGVLNDYRNDWTQWDYRLSTVAPNGMSYVLHEPFERFSGATVPFFHYSDVSVYLAPDGFFTLTRANLCRGLTCSICANEPVPFTCGYQSGDEPIISPYAVEVIPSNSRPFSSGAIRSMVVSKYGQVTIITEWDNVAIRNQSAGANQTANSSIIANATRFQAEILTNGSIFFRYDHVLSLSDNFLPPSQSTTGPFVGIALSRSLRVTAPAGWTPTNRSAIRFDPVVMPCALLSGSCTACLRGAAVSGVGRPTCVWCASIASCVPADVTEASRAFCSGWDRYETVDRCSGNHSGHLAVGQYYYQGLAVGRNFVPPLWIDGDTVVGINFNRGSTGVAATEFGIVSYTSGFSFPFYWNPPAGISSALTTRRQAITRFAVSKHGYVVPLLDTDREADLVPPLIPGAACLPGGTATTQCDYARIIAAFTSTGIVSTNITASVSRLGQQYVAFTWRAIRLDDSSLSKQDVQLLLYLNGSVAVSFRDNAITIGLRNNPSVLFHPGIPSGRAALLGPSAGLPTTGVSMGNNMIQWYNASTVPWYVLRAGLTFWFHQLPGCPDDCNGPTRGVCDPVTRTCSCIGRAAGNTCSSCQAGFGGLNCSSSCLPSQNLTDGLPPACGPKGDGTEERCSSGYCLCGVCICPAGVRGSKCEIASVPSINTPGRTGAPVLTSAYWYSTTNDSMNNPSAPWTQWVTDGYRGLPSDGPIQNFRWTNSTIMGVEVNGSMIGAVDDVPFDRAGNFTVNRFFHRTNIPMYISPNGFISLTEQPLCSFFCSAQNTEGDYTVGDFPMIALYTYDLDLSDNRSSVIGNPTAVRYAVVTKYTPAIPVLMVEFVNVPYFLKQTLLPQPNLGTVSVQAEILSNGTVFMRYASVLSLDDDSSAPAAPSTTNDPASRKIVPLVGLYYSKGQRIGPPAGWSPRANTAVRFDPVADDCSRLSASCTACVRGPSISPALQSPPESVVRSAMNVNASDPIVTATATGCVWCANLGTCVHQAFAAEMCNGWNRFTTINRCDGVHTGSPESVSRQFYAQTFEVNEAAWVTPPASLVRTINLDASTSLVFRPVDDSQFVFPFFYNPPDLAATSITRRKTLSDGGVEQLIRNFWVASAGTVLLPVSDQPDTGFSCIYNIASYADYCNPGNLVGGFAVNLTATARGINNANWTSSLTYAFMDVAPDPVMGRSSVVFTWNSVTPGMYLSTGSALEVPQSRSMDLQLQLFSDGRIAFRYRRRGPDQIVYARVAAPNVLDNIFIGPINRAGGNTDSLVHWSMLRTGFQAIFYPLPGCASDCSGSHRGVCNVTSSTCVCSSTAMGATCDTCAVGYYGLGTAACQPCSPTCLGTCHPAYGTCVCPSGSGRGGINCELTCNRTSSNGTVTMFTGCTPACFTIGIGTGGYCNCTGGCVCVNGWSGPTCNIAPSTPTAPSPSPPVAIPVSPGGPSGLPPNLAQGTQGSLLIFLIVSGTALAAVVGMCLVVLWLYNGRRIGGRSHRRRRFSGEPVDIRGWGRHGIAMGTHNGEEAVMGTVLYSDPSSPVAPNANGIQRGRAMSARAREEAMLQAALEASLRETTMAQGTMVEDHAEDFPPVTSISSNGPGSHESDGSGGVRGRIARMVSGGGRRSQPATPSSTIVPGTDISPPRHHGSRTSSSVAPSSDGAHHSATAPNGTNANTYTSTRASRSPARNHHNERSQPRSTAPNIAEQMQQPVPNRPRQMQT